MANGYRWWYFDALSDDGRFGLTVIGFVGSVFSPYYAAARRRGDADPEAYCAINAILYNPRNKYWALTERGAGDLLRSEDLLQVGPSAISRDGDDYVIDIDEITVPFPRRLRGRVRLRPTCLQPDAFELSPDGRDESHYWWPIAPLAHAEVEFDKPDLRWSGRAYFDSNWGSEPLEHGFSGWHWSRLESSEGSTLVAYAPVDTAGRQRSLAWQFDADGSVTELAVAPPAALPPTAVWRIGRETVPVAGMLEPRIVRTFEDTPFYARSMLGARQNGADIRGFHESLDLQRFSRRWVQTLLPFRMPRLARSRPG